MEEKTIKNLLYAGGVVLGAVAILKLFSGRSVKTAVKETVELPVDSVKKIAKHLVKGSQEAKDYMANLAKKRKPRKSKK